MSRNQNPFIITFDPPQYYSGKDSYVGYRVVNPATNRKERKKVRVNFIKAPAARRRHAQHIIKTITAKLESGWNPFIEQEAPGSFFKIRDVIELYSASKNKELRKNSMKTYNSQLGYLINWLTLEDRLDDIVINFSDRDAVRLMNELHMDPKKGSRTHNNYLLVYRTFWNWQKEQRHCRHNPFDTIRKKKVGIKERILIPDEVRHEIKNHLEKHDPGFLVVCTMLFYCLIRPQEIASLTIKNIDLDAQTIFIPPEVSKNGKGEHVTIPNVATRILVGHIARHQHTPDQYLISDRKTLAPGYDEINTREFNRKWNKLRKALGMEDEMQMYSLKDSGIVSLLKNGISPHDVMRQARHSSLEITTRYLVHVTSNANKEIMERAGGF